MTSLKGIQFVLLSNEHDIISWHEPWNIFVRLPLPGCSTGMCTKGEANKL
jgi:hypothetical protein